MFKHAFLTFIFFLAVCSVAMAETGSTTSSYEKIFTEICELVEEHFYDSARAETFSANTKPSYQHQLDTISSDAEFSKYINEMLETLKASHTEYYTRDDPGYYQLLAIFHVLPEVKELFHNKDILYPSIGILTENINGNTFIRAVLHGSIADKAGLVQGDQILSADGKEFSPVLSLREKIGGTVTLEIRRTEKTPPFKVQLQPGIVNPKQEFLEAERASIQVFETEGKRIGYIHIWSYAGEEYQQEFLQAISWGKLKDADALIWDLRGGWGGAGPEYLNVFNKNVPVFVSKDRNGNVSTYDPQWRKPVVLLINKGVRSGKEVLAYGFKKFQIGTTIGERTAGAVTAGRLFVLSNGAVLYLASRDAKVDGVILEGIGVEPDIEVPMDIRYLEGKDIQLEKALEYLVHKLSGTETTP